MAKLYLIKNDACPDHMEYLFMCPGCKCGHTFITQWGSCELVQNRAKNHNPTKPTWTFNGDMDKPTFSPSLLYPSMKCHLFLRDGVIQFLNDCGHAFAGQNVPLKDLEEDNV